MPVRFSANVADGWARGEYKDGKAEEIVATVSGHKTIGGHDKVLVANFFNDLLIDGPAIRNAHNFRHINARAISNRHSGEPPRPQNA